MNFRFHKTTCEILNREVGSRWVSLFSICEHPLMFCLVTSGNDEEMLFTRGVLYTHTPTRAHTKISGAKRIGVPMRHISSHLVQIPYM